MVKRWIVKWDETEIPDGEYVSAADYDDLVRKVRAHTGYLPGCPRELLEGLPPFA